MGTSRIEDKDFQPKLPLYRLVLVVIVFGVLGLAFLNDKWSDYKFAGKLELSDLFEFIGIGLILLLGFSFIVAFLLLPFRLRFTELGIRRRTVFGPWFVAWGSVRAAHVGNYKGYQALELRIGRWRWICVPLLEYKNAGALLAEIRSRLPVEVKVSDRQLSLLRDS